MSKNLFAVLLLLTTASCTAQNWHQGLKTYQRNECYKMPESQRQSCLQSLDYSYDEYLEERRQSGEDIK